MAKTLYGQGEMGDYITKLIKAGT